VYLLEGAFRGGGYSVLRDPVSSLALGARGWQQIANFILCGLLVLLFSVGLRRSLRFGPGAFIVPLLVAVWGVGLLGAGIFVTDPLGGPVTWHGRLHDLAFSLPGFAALTLAMLTSAVVFARRRSPRFALYSALSGVAFAVIFVVATLGFAGLDPYAESAGLGQRLCVSIGWLWIALLALHRRRARR
jgi:xanthine/uracil permease